MHFHGWDDAYDEWLTSDDMRADDNATRGEWSEYWADPSAEEMFDDDYFYRNDVVLVARMLDMYRTVQQMVNHTAEIYSILIVIIMMFMVTVMVLISMMQWIKMTTNIL